MTGGGGLPDGEIAEVKKKSGIPQLSFGAVPEVRGEIGLIHCYLCIVMIIDRCSATGYAPQNFLARGGGTG
jgi:hypothetical protein